MTTIIKLPEHLAAQLQHRADAQHRSVESLAIEYIEAGLTETAVFQRANEPGSREDDAELLALVARIKALPPNPVSIIPAQGNLAEVFETMVQGESDQALLDALDAAELELRAIDRANDIAEGRG
jgi:plasmid stability protein